MIIKLLTGSFLTMMLLASIVAAEPTTAEAVKADHFGAVDTIIAEVARIDATHWSITISSTNDENVEGLSVPLKLSGGLARVIADSAIYTGGRAAHFAFRGFSTDTVGQTVTLGMVANMGPTTNVLAPGKGRIVTVFVSAAGDKKVEKLVVDTTTTAPNNSLMMVASFEEMKRVLGVEEVLGTDKRLEIYPAFVVRESK